MSTGTDTDELREHAPLEPHQAPPSDRYCDIVLEGGVINGVIYPGFLVELARKFHFHSIGGTSVGAIAGCLAAASEYSRRYNSNRGFNEGLAKMPGDLAQWVDDKKEITRIQSLFQCEKSVERFFNFVVDLIGVRENGARVEQAASQSAWQRFKNAWNTALRHLGPGTWALGVWCSLYVLLSLGVSTGAGHFWLWFWFALGPILLHPLVVLILQLFALFRVPGWGACSGIKTGNSTRPGLMDWLHEGIQKSAGVPYHKPLTFGDLWRAPGGPMGADGQPSPYAINLKMMTSCLSHGRLYEMPAQDSDTPLMFRLSEFSKFFPQEVIAHLRRVSSPVTVHNYPRLQQRIAARKVRYIKDPTMSLALRKKKLRELAALARRITDDFEVPEPSLAVSQDLRLLPQADLPVLVAARLSMSCPILFQCVPLVGLNFDTHIEDMHLVRLWFSDGGIGSNFPIHLFDSALPRWPTFGLKILDESPKARGDGKTLYKDYLPYSHIDGAEDNLVEPKELDGFTALPEHAQRWPKTRFSEVGVFLKFVKSMYTSAKDGDDQSYLRMPEIRTRVIRVYMGKRSGGALNLKIAPETIWSLSKDYGAAAGRKLTKAYLAEITDPRYNWVKSWQDHRWVRFNLMMRALRTYLMGFGQSSASATIAGTAHAQDLVSQINAAVHTPPLASVNGGEACISAQQADELKAIVASISRLEQQLTQLDMPQPYRPDPEPRLHLKPAF